MNPTVMRRRIEKANKKHDKLQEAVLRGLITEDQAKEEMMQFLKKKLAPAFRKPDEKA